MILPALFFAIVAQTGAVDVATPVDATVARSGQASADRLRLLVLDFTAEGTVTPGLLQTVGAIVSAELSTYPDLDVIANADVRRMVELEGARQQSGCGDTSCLAELAGALGARLVVFGSVGTLGTSTVVNLNLFDSATAQSAGREFVEVKDPAELPRVLPGRVRSLLKRTYADAGLVLPAEKTITAPAAAVVVERGPLPAVLLGSGIGGILVGLGTMTFGVWPYLAYGGAVERFGTINAADDGAATAAARERSLAADEKERWESWGIPVAATGSAIFVAGIVTTVIGTSLLASGDTQ